MTRIEDLRAGPLIDRGCYLDPDVFAAEQTRIFERAWLFVAHESEIPNAGDFRTAELAGQPHIALRDDDGSIHVVANSCRHRGATLTEEAEGNCESFKCPYHHWTYDRKGELVTVPRVEGYGPDFDLSAHGLQPVAQMANFHGAIFASLDPDAPSFPDYMGPALPYLEYVLTYDGKDQTVIGYFEYSFNANWKLFFENVMDDYHAEYLHGQAFRQRIDLFNMPGAGGATVTDNSQNPTGLGIHGAIDMTDDVSTLRFQKTRPRRIYVGVFPSVMILYHPVWDVTGIRILQPQSVNHTKVLTYVIGPQDASKERRAAMAERFHYSWGPGGRAGIDDILVLEQVQNGLKANTGDDLLATRGLHRPGAKGAAADEHSVRAFWTGWRQYMQSEPNGPG